jgi:hypothetical protein
MRSGFVSGHEAAVADHVGGKDSCKPTLLVLQAQGSSLPYWNTSVNVIQREPRYSLELIIAMRCSRQIDLHQRPLAPSVAALSLGWCQFDNVGSEAKTRR